MKLQYQSDWKMNDLLERTLQFVNFLFHKFQILQYGLNNNNNNNNNKTNWQYSEQINSNLLQISSFILMHPCWMW